MSYIGNSPSTVAFQTDTFSGNGSTTVFTMSVAPASTTAVLVAISGALQDPSTYSVVGTTLTFSAAPPSGTGNISARYLGIPASGVATTAYRTVTEYTATSGQTSFTVPSYTPGFINVYQNGARLGAADYTATNGTTVVLAVGAVSGDLVTIENFIVSSVLNAIPNTPGAVSAANLAAGAARANFGAGAVLQVVNAKTSVATATSSTSFSDTGLTATITPSSATSKILVLANQNGCYKDSPAAQGGELNLLRGSTFLSHLGGRFAGDSGSSFALSIGAISTAYLDSPATTSATTYKTQFASNNSGSSVYVQVYSTESTITLMEIAA